jgi:predicted GIY-YIG superfamily endonuclease
MADRSPLVKGHLEDIAAKALQHHTAELKALIGGQHGLYALYKNEKLYYVGLASNLFVRVRQHQRDKHKGKWNRFSVYVTRRASQLNELESLALRVISPPGNRVSGRFAKSQNFKREFQGLIKEAHQLHDAEILGGRAGRNRRHQAARGTSGSNELSILSGKRRRLWGRYDGEDYAAVLLKNGKIRYDGETFKSPSAAAKAIKGRAVNGWAFWYYDGGNGEWYQLRSLRPRR